MISEDGKNKKYVYTVLSNYFYYRIGSVDRSTIEQSY